MSNPITIAIKGLGTAGQARLQAIKENPHWYLSGIISRRPEMATLSWQKALQDKSLQAIAISTENTDHYPSIKEALLANKHVLCDYPIATQITEAQELFAIARSQKKILHIEHIALLSEEHAKLKKQVQAAGPLIKGEYIFTAGYNKKIADQSLTGTPSVLAISRLLQVADLWGDFSLEKSDFRKHQAGFSLHLHLKFNKGGLLGFTEERKFGLARRRSLIAKCEKKSIAWKASVSGGGLFAKDLAYFYQRITQKAPCYYNEKLMLKALETLSQAN